MEYQPKTKAYHEKVANSFERQRFMQFIGAKLTAVAPGYCEIHLPHNPDLSQQHGFFHAGVIGTIADNAAGYAAFSLMEESSSVLTVEYKLNLLSPGDGELLIAKANVLKNGRTLTICRSDVYVLKEGKEKLCAAAQISLIELRNTKDDDSTK